MPGKARSSTGSPEPTCSATTNSPFAGLHHPQVRTAEDCEVTVTDTVGFLPSEAAHHLVEAFKSTLDEITGTRPYPARDRRLLAGFEGQIEGRVRVLDEWGPEHSRSYLQQMRSAGRRDAGPALKKALSSAVRVRPLWKGKENSRDHRPKPASSADAKLDVSCRTNRGIWYRWPRRCPSSPEPRGGGHLAAALRPCLRQRVLPLPCLGRRP